MSGEGTHPESENGSHGRTNPRFNDPLTSSLDGNQKTDWPKEVKKMYEDYHSACPGSYSGNEQTSSGGQATEHSDPSVSYLIVSLL